MVKRATGRLGVAVALLVLSAGCLGVLTGSEPFVATADEAGVSDAALSETDFQHQETQAAWINQTVEVGGQEREVRIQNQIASYELPLSVGADGSIQYGRFYVVSTPQAQIAGQAMNPVGRMSHRQLVDRATSDSGGLRDVSQEGTRQTTVLGTETEVTRFSAIAEQQGQEIPVYVEVTRVQDGDDFVIAVGVYPQQAEGVGDQVETLMSGLEH